MRLSRIPLQTLRQDPGDAESPSHRLLVRSGQLLRTGPGLFAHGVLLERTFAKLVRLLEEELWSAGVCRVALPSLQPKELCFTSGSWSRLAAERRLLQLVDRKGAELCLMPGAEEGLLRVMHAAASSHKQLPLRCMAVGRCFEDRPNPRGALLGLRERQQLTVLTCDADEDGMHAAHDEVAQAFERALVRCGVRLTKLHPPRGSEGERRSRAYFAESQAGQDFVLHCDSCGYAAQQERAEALFPRQPDGGPAAPLRKLPTPNVRTVEELERWFSLPAIRMAKTILFEVIHADRDEIVAVLMRGDLEIDPIKLRRELGALAVRTAPAEFVERVTGAAIGFAGPIGLEEAIPIFADVRLRGQSNLLTGCCETDVHCLDVNPGRDFAEPQYIDVARAEPGMPCAQGGDGLLHERRGILLGHSEPRGTGLATVTDALFVTENGGRAPLWVSAHAVDLGRLVAAIVEQHHDAAGLVWPRAVAPFEIVVAILDPRREAQVELAERLYHTLRDQGRDVCLDDRPLSPGAKFKDLDLLGFPLRVIVGRDAAEGRVEFSRRRDAEKELLDADGVLRRV